MQVYINGQATQVQSLCNMNDLIAQLDLTGKRIAVERNGDIIPKSTYGNTLLSEGDRLEIVVAVGGG